MLLERRGRSAPRTRTAVAAAPGLPRRAGGPRDRAVPVRHTAADGGGHGFQILNLDVRESHHPALSLYENLGYVLWGTHPFYASVGGQVVSGNFFYKKLDAAAQPGIDAA